MTIVFKVSDNIRSQMIEYYKDKVREKTPPYAVFQAMEADTIITLYESGKVMFQGISADIDAALWKDLEKHQNNIDVDITPTEEKKDPIDKTYYYYSAIGSDEVGTGDYLLPIVVSATFVDKKELSFLESLGVHDSKKLTDEKIKKLAPKLMKKIPYETLVLSNKDFNNYYSQGINIKKMLAIMHNKVLYNMKQKSFPYQKIILDEFTKSYIYYNYLKEITNKVTGITFITKAEDKNLSVACASIISRYIFLKEKEKLEQSLGTIIPLGAGLKVDEVAKELVKSKGKDILKEISKISFKNTQKIL